MIIVLKKNLVASIISCYGANDSIKFKREAVQIIPHVEVIQVICHFIYVCCIQWFPNRSYIYNGFHHRPHFLLIIFA